jgi:RND family efflux transporter MFP subunit
MVFVVDLSGQSPLERPPAPVVVATAIMKSYAGSQSFLGTVRPRRAAVIGTAVAGRVTEVMVEEGDAVESGQPLVQLLTTTMELELAAAKAELDLRKQELLELENGTRPEELAQAEASVLSAEAKIRYERARRDRLISLFEKGRAASAEERDEAVAAATSAEQNLAVLRAAYALATAGPRVERIAQAKARVDVQQAVVDRLKDQIAKHTIISRLRGYVTAKRTEVGQWVNPGEPVMEVVELNEADIVVSVVEQFIPHIHVGDEVPVIAAALPDTIFTGKVAAVIPQGDEQARTFPVKIRVQNPHDANGPALKAGMLARVNLAIGAQQPCLMVPKDAVVLGGPEPVVFVVRSTAESAQVDHVEAVPVRLGSSFQSLIQITGAVSEEERVVVQGNERLRPGERVRVTGSIDPLPDPAKG